jgi:hypothetical protein
MVRGTIGTLADEAAAGIENSCNALDFGGLEGFFEGKRGKDGGHALGEHGLAGAGWTDR